MNEYSKDNRMPETNLDTILRYTAGAFALIGLYVTLVHKWYNSRFTAISDRIDILDEETKENSDRTADHDVRLAAFEVHIENGTVQRKDIKDSIDRLSDKLDKVIGGN